MQTKCQQTILVNFTSANIIQMVINCNNNDRAERGGMRQEEARGGSWRLTEAATTRQGQKPNSKWVADSPKSAS